jgi:hypothetical protein
MCRLRANSVLHTESEALCVERLIEAWIDWARLELETLPEEFEQMLQRADGRRYDAALDPGDRCLTRPSARRELRLAHLMSHARLPKDAPSIHTSQMI